jgi:SAM-dependent methyltransferase
VYRPTYPDSLYRWLAESVAERGTVWDCGTGNGQAALGLAPHFRRVIATDPSEAQLAHARPAANIEYRVATAEQSGLEDVSIDLVTVAQAAHWFDRPRFFAEVRRVAKPGALLAVWMYNLMTVDDAVDRVIEHLYRDVVGRYWPGDRVLIDSDYRTIEIPFPEFIPPSFEMTAEWNGDHVLGYLRTWSAVARYQADTREDPVSLVAPELLAAWGGADRVRRVRWPLRLRAATVG